MKARSGCRTPARRRRGPPIPHRRDCPAARMIRLPRLHRRVAMAAARIEPEPALVAVTVSAQSASSTGPRRELLRRDLRAWWPGRPGRASERHHALAPAASERRSCAGGRSAAWRARRPDLRAVGHAAAACGWACRRPYTNMCSYPYERHVQPPGLVAGDVQDAIAATRQPVRAARFPRATTRPSPTPAAGTLVSG